MKKNLNSNNDSLVGDEKDTSNRLMQTQNLPKKRGDGVPNGNIPSSRFSFKVFVSFACLMH